MPSRPPARLLAALTAPLLVCSLAAVSLGQTRPRPPRKGSKINLVIDSAPQQAAIYLDDKAYGVVGYTPWKGNLVVGKYQLILERDGFVANRQQIQVSRSQRKFFGVLEKEVLPATVSISAAADSNLSGAFVHIDGKYAGKVPLESKVSPGRHQVILQQKGFSHFSQWVELKAGERLQLAPALKRLNAAPGSLLIDAAVPGAQVWIDGKKHPDATPTVVERLPPGMHAIEVKAGKEGAWTLQWRELVEVKSGQRTKIRAEAKRGAAKAPAAEIPGAETPAAEAPAPGAAETTPPPAEAAGVGTIRILSDVPGAQILLDDKAMGSSPADARRGLDIKFVPVGEHAITAKVADGRLATAKVVVLKDKVVQVALKPVAPAPPAAAAATAAGPTGRLKVTANVVGALVKIDGKPAGAVPLDVTLAVGEHEVLVSSPGSTPAAQRARIADGMLTTVNAELKQGLPNSPMVGKQRDEDLQPVDPNAGRPPPQTGDQAPAKPPEASGGPAAGPLPPLEPYFPARLMRSTHGARTLAESHANIELGTGYPYLVGVRALVGVANRRDASVDAIVAYRTALNFHEARLGARYRFMGTGPLQLGGFAIIGGGGNSGGRNNFNLEAGGAVTLVFGEKVAFSGRLAVDVWSDLVCGEGTKQADATSDTPKGCQLTKDGKPVDAKAAALISGGGADLRDFGVRVLGGLALEVAISDSTNLYATFDKRLLGPEERAGFTASFNSFMFLDDPGWQASAGVSFGL